MGTIHFYYHGGSANHGCEAIVRSTHQLLGMEAKLWTTDIDSDRAYGLDSEVSLCEDRAIPPLKPFPKWFLSSVHHKLTHTDYLHIKFAHNDFFSQVKKGDICLSIGGDNYCYSGQDILAYYHQILRQKGAKTVLWGCSVEPELLEQAAISKDISSYDLIVARESISFAALNRINPNTVLAPDPAFFLETIAPPFANEIMLHNTVGINLSPLIMCSEAKGGIAFDSYRRLLEFILQHTDMNIALIPHVVEPGNDDRVPLQALQDTFHNSERILLIDDHDARQLKGIISRCRFFIGARTHATIAAYSSCVPTLVVGYSVKAKGIAKDLFKNEAHYVIPVQSISNPDTLTQAFQWLIEQEAATKSRLQTFLPEYKSRMEPAIAAVRSLMEP